MPHGHTYESSERCIYKIDIFRIPFEATCKILQERIEFHKKIRVPGILHPDGTGRENELTPEIQNRDTSGLMSPKLFFLKMSKLW